MNKNKNFSQRLGFALHGIFSSLQKERSFQTQVILAIIAIGFLFFLQASFTWWAVFILLIFSILSLELINTSLENLMDRLHPEHHEQIGLAKDCAAGAVLLMCFASLIVFCLFLFENLSSGT